MRLRILSYNIHKGLQPFTGRSVLEPMAEALNKLDLDLLFLQEVVGENRIYQSKKKDWIAEPQHLYLGRAMDRHSVYHPNFKVLERHHGNAVLSRFPILTSSNLDLTLSSREFRGCLHLEVQTETKNLHLLNTHLNLLHGHRKQQWQKLKTYLEQYLTDQSSLIMAGDFNDWRQNLHSEIEASKLFSSAQDQRHASFPWFWPKLPLDRVYVRGFKIHEMRVLTDPVWRKLSDHLPLYAELEID